jgi:hypothetical protein
VTSVTRPGPDRDIFLADFHVSCRRRRGIDAGLDTSARRGREIPVLPLHPSDKCTDLHIFDSYYNFMGEVESEFTIQDME